METRLRQFLISMASSTWPNSDWRGDIVPYVLIVVSWLGVANGAVVTTQEFNSAERCEAARLALIDLRQGPQR